MGKKITSLFHSADDWQNNACLNFKSDMSYGYINGYKEAADHLVLYAAEENKQDFWIYPIAFLYRHHLELILKAIIHKGGLLVDENIKCLTIHKLQKLWLVAKDIIKKIWNGIEDSEFELIDKVINEYHIIDLNSKAFRYPKDISGNKHLTDIRHINLRHLAEVINSVSDLLEGAYAGIEDYLSIKYEVISDSK